jgi:hypothetical protein
MNQDSLHCQHVGVPKSNEICANRIKGCHSRSSILVEWTQHREGQPARLTTYRTPRLSLISRSFARVVAKNRRGAQEGRVCFHSWIETRFDTTFVSNPKLFMSAISIDRTASCQIMSICRISGLLSRPASRGCSNHGPDREACVKRRLHLRLGWGRRPEGDAPRSEASAPGARRLSPARPQPPSSCHLRSC